MDKNGSFLRRLIQVDKNGSVYFSLFILGVVFNLNFAVSHLADAAKSAAAPQLLTSAKETLLGYK
jgi:hypothetical protein